MPHSSATRLALLGAALAAVLGVFAGISSGSSSFTPSATTPRLLAHDTSVTFAGHVPPASSRKKRVQSQTIRRLASAATASSFAGATSSADVPNANGDIGRTQFLQAVAGEYSVYSRTGRLLASVTSSAFWSGLSGPDGAGLCSTNADGQPSVVYDRLADRFVVAEAAYSGSGSSRSGTFYECVAVSSTGDATGTWHRYVFGISTSVYPDMSSLGAWSDGYYLSFNEVNSSGSFVSAGAIAFQRTAMLTGSTATARFFNLQNTIGVGGMVVASNGGPNAPTNGSPALFLQGHDDLIGNNDHLEVWAFHADFKGTGSTFQPIAQVPVAQYDSGFSCPKPGTSSNWDTCLPQSSANSPFLDPLARAQVASSEALPQLGGQVMYGRNGGGQTLAVAQTVNAGSRAGVAWYRLQNTGSGWAVASQGTYAPNDGQSRFVPAAAFDNAGDVALGYALSGSATNPELAYTEPADATVGDRVVGSGGGAHHDGAWGRSTSLRLDPVDLCTFWETGAATAGDGSAYTQIAAFSFSGCTPVATEPVLTSDPTWSSTLVREGQTITGASGSFSGATSTAYQWQRCDSAGLNCVDTGDSGFVHVITAADAAGDRTLRFAESGTNAVGTSTAVSTATSVVQSIPPVNTALPAISGTAATGQVLSVSNGSWTTSSPLAFTYRWRRCAGACADIPGATSSLYTPTTDDVGSSIDVVVSATNTGGGTDAVAAGTPAVVVAPTTTTTTTTTPTTTTTTTTSTGTTDSRPDLKLTVSASPAKPEIGQNVTLFYVVTDKNAAPATKLQVVLTLPTGLTYSGAYAERGPGCVAGSASQVVCSLDYVSALTPVTRVQVNLTVNAPGTLTVAATANSASPDVSPADNTVSIALGSGSSSTSTTTTLGSSVPTPLTNAQGIPLGLNGSEKHAAGVDTHAPTVRALASRGSRGKPAALKFRIYDDSGEARAAATVLRNGRPLDTMKTGFGPVAAGSVYFVAWRVPVKAARGTYSFCVVASDRAKHSSKQSCAPLSVR